MVREWGMSDKVGPLFYGRDGQDMYAHSSGEKMYSTNTEDIIDKEVKILVEEGYILAKNILTKHLDVLHKIAQQLLEKETLTGDELTEIVFGKKESVKKDKVVEKIVEIEKKKKTDNKKKSK